MLLPICTLCGHEVPPSEKACPWCGGTTRDAISAPHNGISRTLMLGLLALGVVVLALLLNW
jgi:hypothetical protein